MLFRSAAPRLGRRARGGRRCVPRGVSASAKSQRLGSAGGAEGAELPRKSRRVQLPAHVAAAGEGAEAICSSARVGVGEGAEACSSTNSGPPRALLVRNT